MKILGIIPARYASSRFPGKPLTLIDGKPMIQHVWERVNAMDCLQDVVVATDDDRIKACVEAFGGEVMMTSTNHRSGTDRCGEVLSRLMKEGRDYDVVINIQGDEPYVETSQISDLAGVFQQGDVKIATLKKKISGMEELQSPNVVKVVCSLEGNALYFSRHTIPFQRGNEISSWMEHHDYFKHIGVYAFRSEVLLQLVKLEASPLEKMESLEQLRWLENGYSIKVIETQVENVAIDTPEDLLKLKKV